MDCLFYDILYFIIILITYDHSFFFNASVPSLRKQEKSDESHHLLLPFITSDRELLNLKINNFINVKNKIRKLFKFLYPYGGLSNGSNFAMRCIEIIF
jgi:hypothetical protein